MVAEVFAGIGAFKALFDLTKSIKDATDVAARDAAVAELREQIFAAQNRYATAIEHIRALEAKVAEFENWDAEKQRYELKDYGGGTFAYAIKPGMENGEPPHRLCEKCYQERKKSILHFIDHRDGQDRYRCYGCNTLFRFGEHKSPPPPGPGPASGDWFGRF